jgi:hypothetical protein
VVAGGLPGGDGGMSRLGTGGRVSDCMVLVRLPSSTSSKDASYEAG